MFAFLQVRARGGASKINELQRLEAFFGVEQLRHQWTNHNDGNDVNIIDESIADEIANAYVLRTASKSESLHHGGGATSGAIMNRTDSVKTLSDTKRALTSWFVKIYELVHQTILVLVQLWTDIVQRAQTVLRRREIASVVHNQSIGRTLSAFRTDIASLCLTFTERMRSAVPVRAMSGIYEFLSSIRQLITVKLHSLRNSVIAFLSGKQRQIKVRNLMPKMETQIKTPLANKQSVKSQIRGWKSSAVAEHNGNIEQNIETLYKRQQLWERFHVPQMTSSLKINFSKLQTVVADARSSLVVKRDVSSFLPISWTAVGACCVGLLSIALCRIAIDILSQRKKSQQMEQEAQDDHSQKELERQRQRFRAVLGDQPTESAVDSTVFAAVKMKGSSSSSKNSSRKSLRSKEETDSSLVDDEQEDEKEPSVEEPETWDDETRRAWESFVKGSKIRQGELWTADAVDTGLPKIWVDVDKDRDD